MLHFFNTFFRTPYTQPHRSLKQGYTCTIYQSMNDVPVSEWNSVTASGNLFLSAPYLKVVEELSLPNERFTYVIIYKDKQPIGVVYFQILDLSAELFNDLLHQQVQAIQSNKIRLFNRYLDCNKQQVVMRLITCGNNYISGEHGFCFSKDVEYAKAVMLVEKVACAVSTHEKIRRKISGLLLKDFYQPIHPQESCFWSSAFIEFSVEPNMIVTIPQGVTTLDNYIGLFSKKYRHRAKHILQLGEGLVVKELTEEDLLTHKELLFSLYEQVFDRAGFKLVKINADYFIKMKKAFANEFKVVGLFKDNELKSFYSAFLLDNMVEAHFIGVDYTINREHELYQNMLYGYIDLALKHKKSEVNLGRTAGEIKTTVGAKAHQMVCYVKPQNSLSKLVLRPFMSFLQPSEWIPRNPFKSDN